MVVFFTKRVTQVWVVDSNDTRSTGLLGQVFSFGLIATGDVTLIPKQHSTETWRTRVPDWRNKCRHFTQHKEDIENNNKTFQL